ncbi:MAG: hypothetical protein ABSD29_03075 [Verrucomicrobiota bacterium]|jgi:hypothetical protein
MKIKTHKLLFSGLLALGAISFVGCQSAHQPGSSSHASLTVKGRSDAEIRQATKTVFAEDGYTLVLEGEKFMGFQRPGSRRDALKWGGWSGEGVVIRAKVKMSKLADDSRLLQLDMFAVRDAGDGIVESESRMILLNKKPYRQLMKEIGKRLQAQ